jgi:LuxR family transcriptional regulator, maltose regulon positive regulatory protein
MVLISAPAGFGKTALAADFLRRERPPVSDSPHSQNIAWLMLEDADNDSHRFWTYLITALQGIQPGLGQQTLALLAAPQPIPPDILLAALVNEMAGVQPQPEPVLVLDELQWIRNEVLHAGILFLLDHWPPGWRVLLLTRIDPPVPLARLRAAGRLTDIRAEDLRFSGEETALYLRECAGLTLAGDDVCTLDARIEGWIAGLQMAASSLRNSADPAAFVRAFAASPRYVLDYLLEEVLQREPADVQSFLLETSVLERLNAPLCDAVTQRTDSRIVLDRLTAADLFLTPLDAAHEWYRYHSLFAELLSRQVRKRPPEAVAALHRRAGEWLAAGGDLGGAIRHALAADDFPRAADWIEQAAPDCLDRSETETLLGWLASLPEDILQERPWLCVHQAWLLLLTGQGEKIEARLVGAERALLAADSGEPDAARLRGYIAMIRGQMAIIRGDYPATIRLANEALANLGPSDQNALSSAVTILGGAYSSMGDFQSGIAILQKARPVSRGGNPFNAIMASSALARMSAICGRLHEAEQIYRDAIRESESAGGPIAAMALGNLYVGLADVLRERDQLDPAGDFAQKGLSLCKRLGQAEFLLLGFGVVAMVQRAQGDLAASLRTLEEARSVASELSAWSIGGILAQLARLHLAMGNLPAASVWAAGSGLTVESEPSFANEYGLLTLVRLLISQDRNPEAGLLLDRMQPSAESGGRRGTLLEIRILRSLSRMRAGEEQEAVSLLRSALELAASEGYVRIFLDEGAPMQLLLHRAASDTRTPGGEYARWLISPREAALEAGARGLVTPGVEPLSEREMEVLNLLAVGLSNAQMAERLVISLNTVKAHLKTIYAKLEAHNRTQAIANARIRRIL